MCTLWPSHSKWLSKQSNESASHFALSLNIPLRKLFGWFRRWQLWATRDWQLHYNNVPTHAPRLMQFFGETSNHPGNSTPLQLRFGTLWIMAFPKIKTAFEREEISDHWWDSGKCDRAADGDWENCVRSQVAYFAGDWAIIFLCTMFLVPSSINVSIFHITWLDTFWTDLVYLWFVWFGMLTIYLNKKKPKQVARSKWFG